MAEGKRRVALVFVDNPQVDFVDASFVVSPACRGEDRNDHLAEPAHERVLPSGQFLDDLGFALRAARTASSDRFDPVELVAVCDRLAEHARLFEGEEVAP